MDMGFEERIHNGRIEVRIPQSVDFGDSLLLSPDPIVQATARKPVERVRNGDNAARDGDFVAFEPMRIAGAIPPFMVMEGQLAQLS